MKRAFSGPNQRFIGIWRDQDLRSLRRGVFTALAGTTVGLAERLPTTGTTQRLSYF